MLSNFEVAKLSVDALNLQNVFLLFAFAVLAVATMKRCTSSGTFMDRDDSCQLKGIAIILVVLGHLWVHDTSARPDLLFGGDAVGLFFLLSGFGLSLSYSSKKIEFASYIKRRLRRIMVPYWVATIIILLLDYLLLQRTYSWQDLMLTIAGVNLTLETMHLDYARWFVTLLLVWYLLFYLAKRLGSRLGVEPVCLLFVCGLGMFLLNYYVTDLGWYQIFAFPIGCLVAQYHGRLSLASERQGKWGAGIAALCLTVGISYKLF